MPADLQPVISGALVGVGGTVALDLWAALLQRLVGPFATAGARQLIMKPGTSPDKFGGKT